MANELCKLNIHKLIEKLRNFDFMKHDFSSNKKMKKLFSLYLCCFTPEHEFERNRPKLFSVWWYNWTRKLTNGLFFLQFPNFSDFMQVYMMQLNL